MYIITQNLNRFQLTNRRFSSTHYNQNRFILNKNWKCIYSFRSALMNAKGGLGFKAPPPWAWYFIKTLLPAWRSQEFCSGGASHWRRQISNFSYFAQRLFWCHLSISGLLQQDMTSNIFYQSASINFSKDKKTFAFAVIIIKQLLTKQFSMNNKSSGKRSAV